MIAVLMGEENKISLGHFAVITFPADWIDMNYFACKFEHKRSVPDEGHFQISFAGLESILFKAKF